MDSLDVLLYGMMIISVIGIIILSGQYQHLQQENRELKQVVGRLNNTYLNCQDAIRMKEIDCKELPTSLSSCNINLSDGYDNSFVRMHCTRTTVQELNCTIYFS